MLLQTQVTAYKFKIILLIKFRFYKIFSILLKSKYITLYDC
jgi:hypothetical protein